MFKERSINAERVENYGIEVKQGNFELKEMYLNNIHRQGVRREPVTGLLERMRLKWYTFVYKNHET
jgi:hypothetical protein